ncbi:hypothetical protein V4F39_01840 [Aquincola sp. MAHUQ-54]|uniref:Uncharacterized protein n=1 Tax=Aquincola agrisoli TaxID=3119538 RepID=A0AAW9Q8Y8_9BURK
MNLSTPLPPRTAGTPLQRGLPTARRLARAAGAWMLMLAAGALALAVEWRVYDALEHSLHLCVPG